MHQEALAGLGLAVWAGVLLTGRRSTGALAAVSVAGGARDELRCDDLTLGNLGLRDGAQVTVAPVPLLAAASVEVAGPPEILAVVPSELLRRALVGKVLTEGDNVSLLPQDVAPTRDADVAAVRRSLADTLGMAWTTALLTVIRTHPAGPRLVTVDTAVNGRTGPADSAGAGPAGRRRPSRARATGRGGVSQRSGVSGRGGSTGSGAAAGPGGSARSSVASGSAGSGVASGSDGAAGSGVAVGPGGSDGSGVASGSDGAAAGPGVPTGSGVAPGPGGSAGLGAAAGAGAIWPEAAGESGDPAPVSLADLGWLAGQARQLREWLDLSFHHGPLLARLGSAAQLGVLVTGPDGSGKGTLVRAVAAEVDATLVRLGPADLAGLSHSDSTEELYAALDEAAASAPAVLLVEDVEALAPASSGSAGASASPLAGVLRDVVSRAVVTSGVAVVGTAVSHDAVDPALRRPGLLDRDIGVPLPDRGQRRALLDVLLRGVPLAPDVQLDEVAARTPGFVTADLLALRREAAVRAAARQRDATAPVIAAADLLGALDTVRASTASRSTVDVPAMSLDDVGDMAATKQALTETVLWPLAHPDSFARLGIDPPRGLLLYGPPGCGKTFLVRALAGTGQVNVIVVKGAELLSMWVGESERGVRELFGRARDAAPSLVFLDEIDALAPTRGQSTDSGVADRVVAALLTELDGVEELRDVVVIGATNRPELIDPALLRPGRLERLIYVPPPDAEARAAILRAAAKNTPLAADVDLTALGEQTDGYSAADCTALVREAALTAMRRSLDAPEVTAADVAAARAAIRPSLHPVQVAALAAFAEHHRPS